MAQYEVHPRVKRWKIKSAQKKLLEKSSKDLVGFPKRRAGKTGNDFYKALKENWGGKLPKTR